MGARNEYFNSFYFYLECWTSLFRVLHAEKHMGSILTLEQLGKKGFAVTMDTRKTQLYQSIVKP